MTDHRPAQALGVAAVVFDLDGTLYPSMPAVVASAALVLRNLRFFRAFGRTRRHLRNLPAPSSPAGASIAELVSLRSAELQRAQNARLAALLRVSSEEAERLLQIHLYRDWAQSFRRAQPFPGVERMLADLRQRGLRLGVLSDSPLVAEKLRYLGIDSFWSVTLAADEVGALKPDPLPFRYIAERIGVATGQVLFVGNSYRYDIVGARNVGMLTAHFSRRRVPFSVADYTFANYKSFPEFAVTQSPN